LRLQFAFTIYRHSRSGWQRWLTILEASYQAIGRPAYNLVFEFWLKIFGVAFGIGVCGMQSSPARRGKPGTGARATKGV
jgi:cytochrome bd-type quinol oxidase subunit 1